MFRKKLFIFGGIVVFLIIFAGFSNYFSKNDFKDLNEDYFKEKVFTSRVIDGDTIECGEERIRLLGVNTPERGKYYYDVARDFLEEIEGKDVEILRDFDDEGYRERKLRYIFYGDRFLNVEILERGLGTSFMLDDLMYGEKLKKAEKFAKDNEIGLWEKSSSECAKYIELVELNADEEYFILMNNYELDCDLTGWTVKDNANHFFKLEKITGNSEKRFDSKGKIWNNNGDRFFMRDGEGMLVIFYEYGVD